MGGPLFGLAGRWGRDERQPRRGLALALPGGVFLAEGVYSLMFNPHLSVGWPLVGAGLLIPLLVGRSNRDRLWGLAALLAVAALGGAAFAVLLWVNAVVSGF